MPKRKPPRPHTVHTKDPRYHVDRYPRGSGHMIPSKPLSKIPQSDSEVAEVERRLRSMGERIAYDNLHESSALKLREKYGRGKLTRVQHSFVPIGDGKWRFWVNVSDVKWLCDRRRPSSGTLHPPVLATRPTMGEKRVFGDGAYSLDSDVAYASSAVDRSDELWREGYYVRCEPYHLKKHGDRVFFRVYARKT